MTDNQKVDYGSEPPGPERPFWQWLIIAIIAFAVFMLIVDSIPWFRR